MRPREYAQLIQKHYDAEIVELAFEKSKEFNGLHGVPRGRGEM